MPRQLALLLLLLFPTGISPPTLRPPPWPPVQVEVGIGEGWADPKTDETWKQQRSCVPSSKLPHNPMAAAADIPPSLLPPPWALPPLPRNSLFLFNPITSSSISN